MQVLFVHGMGRTPISGWWLLWQLQNEGLKTDTFAYATAFEDFAAIEKRFISKILAIASRGDYILIGHSLGGVLIRAAINSLPPRTKLPSHTFLLGSPFQPPRLAKKLANNPIYRIMTGDCGQLLASKTRMAAIARSQLSIPVTNIIGVRGLPWKPNRFDSELNDGVVSISEVNADWIGDRVQIPVIHTLLPLNQQVLKIILERIIPNR